MAPRVLIVDDDPLIRDSLAEALRDDGIEVTVAGSAEEALGTLEAVAPEVILSDIRMSGLSGLDLLRLVRERTEGVDVILMTAYDDMPTVVAAMREGACDFLVKPLDLHDLRRVLERIADDRRTRERARQAEEAEAAPFRMNQLVGHTPRMIAVYKLIGQAANGRASVLVRGETGTGKELIARAIHYNSADAPEPFVPVNCSALPANLLESELFGHLKGSFTGALANRRGRFALAGRGTLFLDEIGDTSPDFQVKLLRVLQEREYYPVGAEKPERTHARVIAATHRNLEEMVARGEFRQDLYYRLRVIELILPPLRERLGDLPLLAEHLVRRASATLGRGKPPVLSKEALEVLLRREWPGNVRELENSIMRAVALATGDVIRSEHVAPEPAWAEAEGPLPTLAAIERQHVARVMAASGNHKARAASILGISRPTLNRLLRTHGLE